MSVVIQVKHRAVGGGGAGSPTGASLPGELAVNFDTAGGIPELWGSDGTAYKRLNPPAAAPTVGTASLPGGTAGSKAGIGAAWTALTAKPSDPVIIATFAGTAYVKTGAGAADADWTALGSATSFASGADTLTGTASDKAVTPAGLMAAGLATPTASGTDPGHLVRLAAGGKINSGFISHTASPAVTATADAGKLLAAGADGKLNSGFLHTAATSAGAASSGLIPLLGAGGKLDASFLTVTGGLSYRGNLDATVAYVAPSPAPAKGDFFTLSVAGSLHASWTTHFVAGQAPTKISAGDTVFFDGTSFHHIANTVDTSVFATITEMNKRASKQAANTLTTAATFTWAAPTTATTYLNGGSAAFAHIDNFTLDCGTF